MQIKIITDTGADLTIDDEKKYDISIIPFHLSVEDKVFVDDDNIDIRELEDALLKTEIKLLSKNISMHSSCPSPGDFLRLYEDNQDKDIMVLTISSKLSGSFNSATLAAKLYKEKYPDKRIHIFDSKSASAGQTALLYKLCQLVDDNDDYETVIRKMDAEITNHTIFVVLERLHNIILSGRLSNGKALLAKILNVKPVLEGKDGDLVISSIQRGMKNAFNNLVDRLKDTAVDFSDKVLVISHENAMDSAQYIETKVRELYNFKDIIILQMRGISTCYADVRGIVVSYF